MDLGFFLTEYFNNSCAQLFLEDPRFERCTGPAVAQMQGIQAAVDNLKFIRQ